MTRDSRAGFRKASSIGFVLVLGLAGALFWRPLLRWFHPESPHAAAKSQSSADAASASKVDHYTCSMHPSVHQQGPGKCPICGMDLVPVTKEQQEQGVVLIDESRRQRVGVRTAPVSEAPMRRTFRAVGQITYDESKLSDVTLKVQGFVTKLFVNRTGQRVSRGQPLLQLYSSELYNAQADFLLARASSASGGTSSRMEALGQAARQRLHLLGLSDAQIDAISQKGTPLENVTISAKESGFVIEKNVVEGAAVEPGARLFRIAALDRVWVEADVYEGDLAHVRVGQDVSVKLDYVPGKTYTAKVAAIYPYLDSKARTGRVRVELANREFELRPGMYASIEFAFEATPKLQVPASAVVYTGPRRLVFLDLGGGRFRPQEIRIGAEADGHYEVLEGLHTGDRIATSGVFLISAEARIRTAAKYWDSADDAADAASTQPLRNEPPASSAPGVPAPRGQSSSSPRMQRASAVYSCPMHPEVQSRSPGKCPKCGMDLELRRPGAAQ